jgi:hypothetical protein
MKYHIFRFGQSRRSNSNLHSFHEGLILLGDYYTTDKLLAFGDVISKMG